MLTIGLQSGITFCVFRLVSGRMRYRIECQVPKGLSDDVVMEALTVMKNNQVLHGLVRGKTYLWLGASRIDFKEQSDAALYIMFLTGETLV